jgi:hypothetical protein
MANITISGVNKEYVQVDTAPDASGYFTKEINIRNLIKRGINRVFFSIRETSEDPSSGSIMTIVLQFKCEGDIYWTDYSNDGTLFNIGDRKIINDMALNIRWRAGVKLGGFTSGSLVFGFDW